MAFEELARRLASKKKGKPPKSEAADDVESESADRKDDAEMPDFKTMTPAPGTKDRADDQTDTGPESAEGATDGDEDDMSSYDDVESSAGDDLADMSGAKDKAGFKTALRQYVEACVRRSNK